MAFWKRKNKGLKGQLMGFEGSLWERLTNILSKSYGQSSSKRSFILLPDNEEELRRWLLKPPPGYKDILYNTGNTAKIL